MLLLLLCKPRPSLIADGNCGLIKPCLIFAASDYTHSTVYLLYCATVTHAFSALPTTVVDGVRQGSF